MSAQLEGLELVAHIADEIVRRANPLDAERNLALSSGVSGQALFFAHLSRRTDPQARYSRLALDCLARLSQELPNAVLHPGLFAGLSGIAWSMQHTARLIGSLDYAGADTYSAVYELIYEYLYARTEYEYDLINGLAGIGLWALTIEDGSWRSRLTDRVIELLIATAEYPDEGATWRTPDCRAALYAGGRKQALYNLGIAHGIPGVAAFLAECVASDYEPRQCGELLDQVIHWMNRNALGEDAVSVFPMTVGAADTARLAWCYGDAGILPIVLRVARLRDSVEARVLSARLSQSVLHRRLEGSGVIDSGVCHGSAGLVHVCTRLMQLHPVSAAGTVRAYWLAALLASRRPDWDFGGFICLNGTSGQFEAQPGLLTGAAGVGLTLLTLHGGSDSWDYPFFGGGVSC